MSNIAHIKIDKHVKYCSECPFCKITCTGYGKSGNYENDLKCTALSAYGSIVHSNLCWFDVFSLSGKNGKDVIPDNCPMIYNK